MTMNARFNLKCALTFDVRMLWLSELAMRDRMSMAFTVRDKTEANELYFQSI